MKALRFILDNDNHPKGREGKVYLALPPYFFRIPL
jgi:hypothetical protein